MARWQKRLQQSDVIPWPDRILQIKKTYAYSPSDVVPCPASGSEFRRAGTFKGVALNNANLPDPRICKGKDHVARRNFPHELKKLIEAAHIESHCGDAKCERYNG